MYVKKMDRDCDEMWEGMCVWACASMRVRVFARERARVCVSVCVV